MAGYRQDFETYAKDLLKCFTEFEESDENHQICMDYLLSNFKHHRFLDVDKHKVKRSLDGIQEKFTIHSQDVKAEAFKTLVDEYIQFAKCNDEDFVTTDTPFSVLCMLLLLAEEPTGEAIHLAVHQAYYKAGLA